MASLLKPAEGISPDAPAARMPDRKTPTAGTPCTAASASAVAHGIVHDRDGNVIAYDGRHFSADQLFSVCQRKHIRAFGRKRRLILLPAVITVDAAGNQNQDQNQYDPVPQLPFLFLLLQLSRGQIGLFFLFAAVIFILNQRFHSFSSIPSLFLHCSVYPSYS
jgi:hypothetical protein